MTSTSPRAAARFLPSFVAALAGLAFAGHAGAQVEQFLRVDFIRVSTPVPLSDWLTAGIALVLAATAFVVLHRQRSGGRRLLGWMLVALTGSVLLAATGQRLVSDARAGYDPAVIDLTVSPGSLALSQYVSLAQVEATVTNTTGQPVIITAIALTPPSVYFAIDPKGSTCTEGLELLPAQSCTVLLIAQET